MRTNPGSGLFPDRPKRQRADALTRRWLPDASIDAKVSRFCGTSSPHTIEKENMRMISRYTRYLALAAVLLLAGLALVATACNGSDTASTTAGSDTAVTTASTSGSGGGPLVVNGTTSTVPAGETGVVEVKGLIDNPTTLKAADLEEMTVVTITVDDPVLGKQDYKGVRLSELFASFGLQRTAARLAMTAHADGFVTELALQDIQWSPDAMLAIGDDGKLNIVIPDLDSKTWVKDVISLEFK
jgi:hypothetical protein